MSSARPALAGALKPTSRARLLRWLRVILLVLLLGPALLLLVYRVTTVPVTPLMLVRMAQGYGLEKQWVPLSRISGHLPRAVRSRAGFLK